MTLHNYHPKILEFLYQLTKLDRFMSYREIANHITISGKKVNPKTIQKYFKFLKRPYNHPKSITKNKFDYYPSPVYEKLGLMELCVLSEGVKFNEMPILSNKNYIGWLYNPRYNKHTLITKYLIPPKKLGKFEIIFNKLKYKSVISDFKFYLAHSGFTIYSKFDKTIDKSGNFIYENNDYDEINNQIFNFKTYLKSIEEVNILDKIKKNPLIIPVLFEYQYEFYSSIDVWNKLKLKLNNDVWLYFRKFKRKSDFIGIKKVQNTLSDIKNLNLYNQIRVIYVPLEVEKNFIIYAFIDFKNKENLLKNIKEFALHCILLRISPIDKNKALIAAVINNETLQIIFSLLEKLKIEKFYFLDYNKSFEVFTDKKYYKFDYSKLFDPKKLKWLI